MSLVCQKSKLILSLFTNIKQTTQFAIRNLYTAEYLLNEQNRQRTMKCMKQPKVRGKSNAENKRAAVLITLCRNTNNDELSILFTKRSANLSRHSSQISFPGGLCDAEDNSAIECALRECEEEIGLSRHSIDIWGEGGCIKNPRSADVTPVVGVVCDLNIQQLTLNAHEVSSAFTVPLSELADPLNLHYTQFRRGYSMPVFLTKPQRVWGLTAYMTFNFLNCLLPAEANWHQHKQRVQYMKPISLCK